MGERLGLKDGLELYETGKHRRYTLWFAVNGGAFTVARLLVDSSQTPGVVLGGLTLRALSLGMILFTLVLVADIFAFGVRMAGSLAHHDEPKVFGPPGRVVLIVLGLLLCAGWLLVGFVRT